MPFIRKKLWKVKTITQRVIKHLVRSRPSKSSFIIVTECSVCLRRTTQHFSGEVTLPIALSLFPKLSWRDSVLSRLLFRNRIFSVCKGIWVLETLPCGRITAIDHYMTYFLILQLDMLDFNMHPNSCNGRILIWISFMLLHRFQRWSICW